MSSYIAHPHTDVLFIDFDEINSSTFVLFLILSVEKWNSPAFFILFFFLLWFVGLCAQTIHEWLEIEVPITISLKRLVFILIEFHNYNRQSTDPRNAWIGEMLFEEKQKMLSMIFKPKNINLICWAAEHLIVPSFSYCQ